ncbi:hypothetical protein [Aliivibrio salmonicida]|uniref:hypothetical protein n=1 Tax=Aliivibrio salmonicida TaxID=40269 RepID=UPI003D0E69AC
MSVFDYGYFTSIELWIFFIFCFAAIDRWYLRNGTVTLFDIDDIKCSDDFVMFGLAYESNQRFIKSELCYSIRDMNNPTTVISGKTRTLDFAKKGMNNEFLLIKKNLLTNGDWIVDVKVTTTGSRINPFHKIFPIETHLQKQVEIKL